MTGIGLVDGVALPIALGLLGFLEPCSIASSAIVVRHLEGADRPVRRSQLLAFALARGAFVGLLGASAAWLGTAFLGFQRTAWVLLGALYIAIGVSHALGAGGWFTRALGRGVSRTSRVRGSAALGVLFGLNVPACAAPLLLALFGAAAAGGAAGASIAAGFVSLALFGLALSLPLVAAVAFAPVSDVLDRLSRLSRRIPLWTGLVLVALGVWSIALALRATWPEVP